MKTPLASLTARPNGTLAVAMLVWLGGSVLAIAAAPAQNAAAPERTVWDRVFSAAQATRGETVYKRTCSECHRDDLRGSDGPPLTGLDFFIRWREQSLSDMLEELQPMMPASKPGSVEPQTFLDIMAFLFKANGVPVGTTDLLATPDALEKIVVTEKPKS